MTHPREPDQLRSLFRREFKAEPDVSASAPGRVNIVGEHTDYNGGEVLPIAINRRVHFAARVAPKAAASTVYSSSEPAPGRFDASSPARTGEWSDYIAGVCAELTSRGIHIPQFEAAMVSDVPIGAGLSSSAAVEVAASVALTTLAGRSVELKELAIVSWRAENEFVGVGCGVMDQFASALCQSGRALHLWCDTLATETVRLDEHVLIFDTATPRSLRASEFNARRAECEQALALLRRKFPDLPNLAAATPRQIEDAGLPSVPRRRALHVVNEVARVHTVVDGLKATGRIPGEVLYESHESLRTLFECSTAQLDWFVDRMRGSPGVSGARLTGAGWGGCAIAVGERDHLTAAGEAAAVDYQREFGVKPRIWLTVASDGARVDAA
jgi:galactokinase